MRSSVAAVVFVACSSPAPEAPLTAAPAAPTLPTCPALTVGTVSSPFFQLTDGAGYGAGKAVLVDAGGTRVLLTAHHLFSPAGGVLDRQLTPEELPTAVEAVVLHDQDSGAAMFRLGPPRVVPGAAPSERGVDLDLAVFDATDLAPADPSGAPTPQAVPLADRAPAVGDWVCLTTATVDKFGTGHLAKVTASQPGRLHYELLAPTRMLATDGAPVLNLDGELVGLHLVGKNGPPSTGIANPIAGVRTGLRAAGLPVAPLARAR